MKRINRQLYNMTWPIALELILTGIINTASQYLLNAYSKDAMAVVGSLSQIVNLVINLYTFISVGGSILLAPMVGAGQKVSCEKLVKTLILTNLGLGILVSILTVCGIYPFLNFMQIDRTLYRMGKDYLMVSLGLSVIQSMLITYTAVLRSFGMMKSVLTCNFLVYLVCFFSNALIYALISIEKQRLLYYSLSGILGQSVGVCYLHHVIKRKLQIQVRKNAFHFKEWQDYLRKTLKFGVPAGMEGIIYLLVQMIVVSFVGGLGTEALLVKAYVSTFGSYMVIGTSAVNTAVFVLVGQFYGRRDQDGIWMIFREGLFAGLLVAVLTGAILLFFSGDILLFFTKDQEVIRNVQELLYAQLFLEIIRVLTALAVSALKAVGEIKIPFYTMIIGGFSNILISYYCGILLEWGLIGIWFGFFADLIIRSAVEGTYFYRYIRKWNQSLHKKQNSAQPWE